MPDDPILEVLDDILDNGARIPAKVSNRLLLAASIKGIRQSCDNKESLEKMSTKIDRNATRIYILATVVLIMASLLGAHLGGIEIPFILP